jgi:Ca-activated chloride channel family protein
VDNPDGAYNLGNALARQGRYEEAIAAYDRALAGRPGMEDALANRKAVEAAMKRKPPQGANKNQPNPRQSQPGKSQSRPGSQGDPGQSGEDAQQARKPPQQDSQQEGKADTGSEPPTQDPAQQRAADAAQRQRMQRALEQQKQTNSGQDVKGKPDRAEQAAQRERSIANEAWLRRVPDDPGALLRAKFQLEYERRQARGED